MTRAEGFLVFLTGTASLWSNTLTIRQAISCKKKINGRTTAYLYDNANQLTEIFAGGESIRCRYDAAGRLVKEGETNYSYAYMDRLVEIQERNLPARRMEYFIDGQVAKVSTPGSDDELIWDDFALLSRGNIRYLNEPAVCGASPVMADRKILFQDILGTTLGVMDAERVDAKQLSAFGESLQGETPSDITFFTGKPFVGNLGYAFLFRTYRSAHGRWQSADPAGYPSGWNNQLYCNNRAVNMVDPLGLAEVLGTSQYSIADYCLGYLTTLFTSCGSGNSSSDCDQNFSVSLSGSLPVQVSANSGLSGAYAVNGNYFYDISYQFSLTVGYSGTLTLAGIYCGIANHESYGVRIVDYYCYADFLIDATLFSDGTSAASSSVNNVHAAGIENAASTVCVAKPE
ncbi:MAG: hypothetical protein PHS41_09445 [Victivallaceae bacterium]|nr:hypothetical protein [Victivallaceae bacterium]